MRDLSLEKDYKRGNRGKKVRLIQEWLCLNGFGVCVDGDFGPATDYAVRKFQGREGIEEDGIVGIETFQRLVRHVTDALEPIPPNGRSLGEMVITHAEKHLQQKPREIGGQNRGPWVRLYMNGKEGADWPWCAGFACFILRQACHSLNAPLPFKTSVSCDTLAANAKQTDIFLRESEIVANDQITPGSLFLNRRTPQDWVHTGIVIRAEREVFETIEGNTNDDGNREGYEVCRRIRGYKKKDFILI